MNKLVKLLSTAAAFALPAITLAQAPDIGVVPGGNDAFDLLGVISNIFGVIIPILITFAVIWVIVGVIKYATADGEEDQTKARKMILHAIIALFVIVSIWGLVAILGRTFGVGQGGTSFEYCQEVYNPNTNTFQLPPECQ